MKFVGYNYGVQYYFPCCVYISANYVDFQQKNSI